MTDDEKAKKSIERNRKKRANDVPKPETKRASSFKTLCQLLNAPHTAKYLAIATAIAAVIVYKLSSGRTGATTIESIGFALLTIIVIGGGYALYLYSWYPGYKKFVQEKSHLSEEWVFFVGTRSEEFMKGDLFAKVTVSIKPTALANADHHKAIDEFLSRWKAEGSDIYSGSKWSGSRPDSLDVNGKSISGHVNVTYGMKLLLKKLIIDIPELKTKLGKECFASEISWSSERSFEQLDARDSIDEMKEDERFRQMRDKE
jgi:hypothetical protein